MTPRIVHTSIRWQLLAWFALLLVGLFAGFGIAAYQLTKTNRLGQIDEAIGQRVAKIAEEMRAGPSRPPMPSTGASPEDQPLNSSAADTKAGPPPPPIPGEPDDEPVPGSDRPKTFANRDPGRNVPPPKPADNPKSPRRQYQLSDELLRQFPEADPNGYFYIMWSPDGAEKKRSTNAPATLDRPQPQSLQPGIKFAFHAGHRIAYYFTERQACALVGLSLETYTKELHRFLGWLALAGVFTLGLGTTGAWFIASRALYPIDKIAEAARHIADGHLSERIATSESASELGQLTAILNTTFARLETAFQQQRQFTADASHEIRTPLAVIISEAQATLARPRSNDEYRETLETCLEAAQELRKLADSLLELARIDANQDSARLEDIDLAAIAHSCTELVLPLAETHGIAIENHLEPAKLRAHAGRIRQVLINLLDNAIHYSYDRGNIRVETRSAGNEAILVVSDTGRGIAPEDLPYIFKRFYRADKARTQTDRRAGLGLAIVKSVIDLHKGTIEVKSQLGLGTTFTIRVPRNLA